MNILLIVYYLFLEYGMMFRNYLIPLFKPFPSNWKNGHNEILILPGFSESWSFFKALGDCLNTLGYKITYLKELEGSWSPLQNEAMKVKKYILENSIKKITLISHSKGGLIGKVLIDDPEVGKRITNLIAVSAPFHGSIWGHLRILSLSELIPGNPTLKKLHSISHNNAKIYNIFAKIDNHVIPNRNLVLEGANNTQIDVVGHTRVMDDKRTLKTVTTILST